MVSSALVMDPTPVVRRNPPGTKSADFFKWPEQSFDEMDSTLVVQQYIQQLIRKDFKDVVSILVKPPGQDEGVWKYEHLRQFCLELNGLAVRLQHECKPETCSQMTATEQWIFLCAAHKTPKECPAIDYTRHTLDGAACLLNSNKYFPSRVSIKESSVAKLGSVCRRVYRIFSHAYYHHRHIFDEAENETALCCRFTSFVIKYKLMSRDNLIVPVSVPPPFSEIMSPPKEPSSDVSSNQSNNNSSTPGTQSITIAKKPESESGRNTGGGIASFLNLPEGVVPDPDDNDEDAVAENIEIDFSSAQLEPEPDDEDSIVDDDFSYSDENSSAFKTIKLSKEQLDQNRNNSNNSEASDKPDQDFDNTVIENNPTPSPEKTPNEDTVTQEESKI